MHWLRKGKGGGEGGLGEPVIYHAPSTAIFSYLSSLQRAQLPLSHAIMKSSINSEVGKAEAARCLLCHTGPAHTASTKEASHLLPVFAPSTHCNKLSRNSYFSPQRDQTRQSAPGVTMAVIAGREREESIRREG